MLIIKINQQRFIEIEVGRSGGIRTHDPLHPMQVRYQAALRPEKRFTLKFLEFHLVEF